MKILNASRSRKWSDTGPYYENAVNLMTSSVDGSEAGVRPAQTHRHIRAIHTHHLFSGHGMFFADFPLMIGSTQMID